MSAILGILSKRDDNINEVIIKEMQDVLRYRGNDDLGYSMISAPIKMYPYCAIASNQRYSRKIKYSHQPAYSEKQEVVIVFDGEIYDNNKYYDLNESSEVDIIFELYMKFGINGLLERLKGMWAMCIIDKRVSKVYLVRDKMGEKPLYVYQKEELLMFASEYKVFYCHPEFKSILNEDALSEYFVFRYACGETTFIKDVINLAPGSYLEISNNEVKKIKYYTLPKSKNNTLSREQNKSKLNDLLYKSVNERLRYTENLGAQLSGGVDSSYICYAIKDILNKSFNTYSVTFRGQSVDESEYVDYVNNYLNLQTNKFNCSPCDFLNSWKKSTYHFEAPMNHEGTLPLYDLNKLAADNVSVILCGDGPDESMGGYPIFRRLDCFYRDLFGLRWLGVKIKAFFEGKKHYNNREAHFISLHQFIKDKYVKLLRPRSYRNDISKAYKKRLDILKKFACNDHIHKFSNYDLMTYGVECAIRTERMAMAHGLTVRSPFLSTELQEFLLTVPPKLLTDYKEPYVKSTKILLKELCSDVFGEEFTYRPKVGLGVPNHEIFANISVRQYIEENIMPSIKQRGVVNYEFIREIWQLPLREKNSYDPNLLQVMWVVFSFEVWAQMFIDNNPLEYIKK
jgi:asparagine synthase (glutamine-hydrolysing)